MPARLPPPAQPSALRVASPQPPIQCFRYLAIRDRRVILRRPEHHRLAGRERIRGRERARNRDLEHELRWKLVPHVAGHSLGQLARWLQHREEDAVQRESWI